MIDLPTSTPFGDVSYQPVAGWSATVVDGKLPKPAKVDGTTVTEAPTQVVWTADPGTELTGGQFQDFVLSVGPMPDTGRIAFPTTQTYSDGKVVKWTEPTTASGAEPDLPAPVLYINDAPPATERLTSGTVGVSAQAPAAAGDVTVVLVVAAAALAAGGPRRRARGRRGRHRPSHSAVLRCAAAIAGPRARAHLAGRRTGLPRVLPQGAPAGADIEPAGRPRESAPARCGGRDLLGAAPAPTSGPTPGAVPGGSDRRFPRPAGGRGETRIAVLALGRSGHARCFVLDR